MLYVIYQCELCPAVEVFECWSSWVDCGWRCLGIQARRIIIALRTARARVDDGVVLSVESDSTCFGNVRGDAFGELGFDGFWQTGYGNGGGNSGGNPGGECNCVGIIDGLGMRDANFDLQEALFEFAAVQIGFWFIHEHGLQDVESEERGVDVESCGSQAGQSWGVSNQRFCKLSIRADGGDGSTWL